MDEHNLITALAVLVIAAAALGLRECPCDDRNCVRAHNLHKAQEREAQELTAHRLHHREFKSSLCRYCNGTGDQ